MKNNVLDFIESKTLRQQLSGKQLEPAIECILIAQCYNRTLEDKLEALQERYEAYSAEEFKKGVYNSCADNFREALKWYISYKEMLLKDIEIADENTVYVLATETYAIDRATWSTLDDVLNATKRLSDDESFTIIKQKMNNPLYDRKVITFNPKIGILNIFILGRAEEELLIENAYAELPHLYEKGDIVRCGDDYAVVADVIRHETLPPYMIHSDDIDMCLFCLGYYEDKMHSCGGSFVHEHISLLKAEICSEEELPEKYRPLIAISRLFKGEIRIVDFVEMYSNRDIDSLIK